MGRNSSFLPSTDAGLLSWARNLSERVSASAGSFGVSPERAEGLAAAYSDFAQAMLGVDPSVRCKSSVKLKNTSRDGLKQVARQIVSTINGHPGVSDSQKIELGLTVRAKWSRRSGPAEAPCVDVTSVEGHLVRIRLHAQDTSDRRALPDDADGASLFTFVGNQSPQSESDLKFETNISRTTAEILFPPSIAPGERVWIVARWFGGKKQPGPMSRAVYATIQFGQMRLAA